MCTTEIQIISALWGLPFQHLVGSYIAEFRDYLDFLARLIQDTLEADPAFWHVVERIDNSRYTVPVVEPHSLLVLLDSTSRFILQFILPFRLGHRVLPSFVLRGIG